MTQGVYDAIIIGGGFFGCRIAQHLRSIHHHKRILILEKESDLLQRASYVNQARVHNGYHYPRSILTALRSRVNFPAFVEEYKGCIDSSFKKYYAVGKLFSKVSANQYFTFCQRIGAEIKPAPKQIKRLFNDDLIDGVFETKEYAFDAVKLKQKIQADLVNNRIEFCLNADVQTVGAKEKYLEVVYRIGNVEYIQQARKVFNCTYSLINQINRNSALSLIPLKHELTEMLLMDVPPELKNIGVTVMCGPFFSLMPFPPRNLHSLSHVRYTPHTEWHDREGEKYNDAHQVLRDHKPKSALPHIIRDVRRYFPSIMNCRYVDSLWEIKTVLPQSEVDDSRPILFKSHHGLPNYTCIMGGKLDNIYDALKEIDLLYG